MQLWTQDAGRVGAQPFFIAFWGAFPDITEALLDDENETKSEFILLKRSLNIKIYAFLMKRIGSPKNSLVHS